MQTTFAGLSHSSYQSIKWVAGDCNRNGLSLSQSWKWNDEQFEIMSTQYYHSILSLFCIACVLMNKLDKELLSLIILIFIFLFLFFLLFLLCNHDFYIMLKHNYDNHSAQLDKECLLNNSTNHVNHESDPKPYQVQSCSSRTKRGNTHKN